MSDLDERLKDIFDNCFGITISGEFIGRVKEATKDIKQAFKDDGWVKHTPLQQRVHGDIEKLMTGQEWFEKFKVLSPTWATGDTTANAFERTYQEVARKAAGIE